MRIKLLLLPLLVTIYSGFSQNLKNTISGRVTDLGLPLENVAIAIKGSANIVRTNDEGRYTLMAKPRDVLTFAYGGMRPVEIVVEDVTSVLNIQMSPRVKELDEVVVKKKKRKTREDLAIEYERDKNLIRTAFGVLDKKTWGFAATSIDESEINTAFTSFLDVIRGKFNGSIQDADPLHPVVCLNSGMKRVVNGSCQPVIYDLDGQIIIDPPIFIVPQDIKRIMILNGTGAMARYGNRGAGGVIIINTKMGNSLTESGSGEPYDYAKLRNNIFDVKSLKSVSMANTPAHLKELYAAATERKALSAFEAQVPVFGKMPYYLLDAGNYFYTKWKNKRKAEEIFKEIERKFSKNASVLKTLAYYYEEHGNKEAALRLYKEIFKLRPRYAQSYRDLANAYMELGEQKKAIGLYGRFGIYRKMDTLPLPEKGFVAIDSIMRVEARNAMAQYGSYEKGPSGLAQDNEHWPVRILVEWNNSEAEFDLQFVHPSNHYYNWQHSLEFMPERIRDEKLRGYSAEQFLLEETSVGDWMLNLKYLGNKSFDPTYLKITTFHDFGTLKQRKDVRVIKLWEKNVNQHLFSVHNYGGAASR